MVPEIDTILFTILQAVQTRTLHLRHGSECQLGIGKHFHGDLRIRAEPSIMLPSPVSAEVMLLDTNK